MTTGQKEPSAQVAGGFNVSAFGTHGTVPKEAELEWFFSSGQSLFEASTFGALLERQATYGQVFEMCLPCNGTGFTEDDSTCPRCRGMGGKPEPKHEKAVQRGLLFSTSRCLACIKKPLKPRKDGKPHKAQRVRPRPVCRSCSNARFHERYPVGMKAEAKGEPSYTPDDVALRRFAQVSRYLRQCSAGTVETLAAFFGLSGYRWANTKWGRLFAVVPLTDAGEAMLHKMANPLELTDHELLENVVKRLEQLQDKDHRKQAQERLETVTRQAAARFKAAAEEWRSVVEPNRGPVQPMAQQVAA